MGLTVYAGDGNDVVWANRGDNVLFGDAENDILVGAGGNDILVGGSGNDTLHGGGGNDIFCFCENWGNDTVEQLSSCGVTLWFQNGSMDNWDAEALTYSDGANTVSVKGVAAESISLKFGVEDGEQFLSLSDAGAFAEYSSTRIFSVAS